MKKDGYYRNSRNRYPSDSNLLAEIVKGNDSAFEIVFKSYYQLMVNFAFLFVREISAAENIVQDVFVKIWGNRTKIKSNIDLKAYLYRATKNKAIDYLRHLEVRRRKAQDLVHSPNSENETPEDALAREELVELLIEEIDRLPEKCRTIFFMNKYEKLKYADIAAILNVSVKTVENQLVRAMGFLRRRILEKLFWLVGLFFL